MRTTTMLRAAALVLAFLPTAALAHTGISEADGFAHGLAHPFSGLDHVLAMVLVGLFAVQIGGRALWLVPTAFVAVMALGGAAGAAGIGLPFVETGIALSAVVLGAAVAFAVKAPVALAIGVVGLFAIFHGHAHGAEIPENAGGIGYAAGFMLATAVLHCIGIGLGMLAGRIAENRGQIALRAVGSLAAAAGVGMLTGLI